MPGGRHEAELASPLTTAVHEREQARHLRRRDRESQASTLVVSTTHYRTRHSGPRSGNILLPEALAKLVIVMSLALNSPLIGPVTMPSKPQLGAVSSAISRPTPLSFSTTTYEPSCWSLSKVAITVSTLGISCPGLTMNRRGFDRTS